MGFLDLPPNIFVNKNVIRAPSITQTIADVEPASFDGAAGFVTGFTGGVLIFWTAFNVAASISPVMLKLLSFWKLSIAAFVRGPMKPSALPGAYPCSVKNS